MKNILFGAPWYIEDKVPGAEIGFRAIVDSEGFTVCNPSPMGADRAALIALAPAMLGVLEMMEKEIELVGHVSPETVDQARTLSQHIRSIT